VQEWEYKTLEGVRPPDASALDGLGALGWELVNLVSFNDGMVDRYRCYLKRPKSPTLPPVPQLEESDDDPSMRTMIDI
jgi:hypothetical protein